MNKKEIIKKIKLYEIDLEFCKEAGYKIVAKDIEAKIKALNALVLQPMEVTREETIEDLIKLTEDWIHFNEDLEYILRQIPNQIKSVIVQEMV